MKLRAIQWLQLVLAILATALAAISLPGIMVVIPVTLCLLYVAVSAWAVRDAKVPRIAAFSMTLLIAAISIFVVSAEFVFESPSGEIDVGSGRIMAVDGNGESFEIENPSPELLARLQEIQRNSSRMDALRTLLLLVVAAGSASIIFARLLIAYRIVAPNSRK